MSDHAKRLAEIEALIAGVPGGVWSWEEHSGSRWTLYVNRGEPIDPDWPAGICNRQHGLNILRGDEGTFDGNGANLRAFIVGAREALSWLLAERRAASDALTAAGITDDGRTLAERVKAPVARGPAPTVDAPEDLYQAHPLIWADRVKAMASAMPETAAAVFRKAVDRAARVPGLEQANREAHQGIAKLKRRLEQRSPTEAALPDIGIAVAHGATAQGLAEDVASQVLHVVAEYVMADPVTLAPDALALRGRIRERLGLPPAPEMPAALAKRCDVCGRASLLGLDHDYHPEPDIEPAEPPVDRAALVGLPSTAETTTDPWLDEPLTSEELAAIAAAEATPGAGEPW